jgi:UDP-sulfoquinovose synthase
MRILILGGDGYLGWATSMHFSALGHEVCAVDNYFRRSACLENDISPLIPTPTLQTRCELWQEVSGKTIAPVIGDICNYDFLKQLVGEYRPDTIIHYAEQPSAPYSMMGQSEAAQTLQNNLLGTLNVAYAVKECDPSIHIVKLGTMGEYGTPNIDIEEGFLDIEHKGRKDRFLFPRQAGSLYHTTKVQDTDLLYFYVRTWKLRVTDLMQGPVYGIFTDAMGGDERLATNLNYDHIFGTVLNRFMVQAVAGYPLTVYGKGGQTRGYLNIKDTMQCLQLASENPAGEGELRIFNQFTETFSVNDLAERVVAAAEALQLQPTVEHIENPRVEREEHYYNPVHSGLKELGLQPNLLTQETLVEMLEAIGRHKDRIDIRHIKPSVSWTK